MTNCDSIDNWNFNWI